MRRMAETISADTAAILNGTSTRYGGDKRTTMLFEKTLIYVNEQSTWHHQGYLAEALQSHAIRLTDKILETHNDQQIRNLLLNRQAFRDLLDKLIRNLLTRPKKLLQEKLAAFPVTHDVVERTAKLILENTSDNDLQKILRQDSNRLEIILKENFYDDFYCP